ncbi:response regulator [Massilia sp. W12]|uniref:response regulator n=1 Tax=Massilia sp. W12 TaxID=3126507 RepID=UPI0030CBF867
MGLKAMIIDPSAISRDLLNAILLNESYEVVAHASQGRQALALAQKHKPQIICVDMSVVYEEGMDFMAEVRRALPKTLVFMMSNELKRDTLQDALQRGVQAVIIKPFNSVKVAATIKNAVLAFIKKQQAAAAAKTVQEEGQTG